MAARPARSILRTAVVSLALVGGTLVVTPAPASALLPCGTLLTPPCSVAPDTVITGMTPTPNSANWVNRRTVEVTFDHSYPEGQGPPATDGDGNPTGPTTYECRLQAPEPQDWAPCTSPKAYTGLPDTDRGQPSAVHTIGVRAVHPDGTKDATPDSVSFRLDATEPDTHLLGAPTLVGPRQNLLLDNTATFQYAVLNHSDETNGDPVFRCTFDGRALPCPDTRKKTNGARTITGIKAGDHRFTVAGVDQAGNASRPPEAFAFHTPYNRVGTRRQINRMWTRVAAPGHYLDDYVVTRKKGSVLSRKFRNFNEVYLIVAKGPRHGRIRVDIGNTRVRTAKLSAKKFQRKRIVKVNIPGGRRTTGRIKVTVISPSGRTVMIDAIAVR
ncbi:MAG: hypothetical protein Q8Q02_01425 [Nocardioides sp.]|nr:hypothetical protein [Nocardioides sp.]